MVRKETERNSAAVIYLFLGDECGALTVRGVVGEVVREGFGSIPHRITCDAIRELWKTEEKDMRIVFSLNHSPSEQRFLLWEEKVPSGW